MKIEASVKCPLTSEQVAEIRRKILIDYPSTDVEIYIGIDRYVIINLGKRSYKYRRCIQSTSVVAEITNRAKYMIQNHI